MRQDLTSPHSVQFGERTVCENPLERRDQLALAKLNTRPLCGPAYWLAPRGSCLLLLNGEGSHFSTLLDSSSMPSTGVPKTRPLLFECWSKPWTGLEPTKVRKKGMGDNAKAYRYFGSTGRKQPMKEICGDRTPRRTHPKRSQARDTQDKHSSVGSELYGFTKAVKASEKEPATEIKPVRLVNQSMGLVCSFLSPHPRANQYRGQSGLL